jgi:membrane fusion protein (multidrug efflux system)
MDVSTMNLSDHWAEERGVPDPSLDPPHRIPRAPLWRRIVMRLLWVVVGLLVVAPIAYGLIQLKLLQFQKMSDVKAAMVVPPSPVNAAEVREEVWQPRVSAVGSVTAIQGIVVRTEAAGVVREIAFEPGATVEAGAKLIQLDDDVEQAELRAALAAEELARVSFERIKGLLQSRSVSQAEFDTADANLRRATAQVDNLRAVIDKKLVRAPFAGKLGIRDVSVGQFLDIGSPVVSLQSLDPIYVEFSLPQQRLGDLAEGLKVIVSSDAYADTWFDGTITAINPDVDTATRNVRIQATLSNSEGRLRPGMFVSVELILDRSEQVLFIPSTAVLHAPFGDSVFVIERDPNAAGDEKPLVVRQRFVELGARQGDFVMVTSGLAAGEQIVSTGVFKLRPGTPVVIDNTLAPEFKLTPNPKNT